MVRRLLLASILALPCSIGMTNASAAAPPPDEDSAPATPSSSEVRQAMDYYDQWLAYQQRYRQVPGVQAAVRVGDKQVFAHSYGMADLERRTPLTDAHLFRIASHSKTFTGTAVMQLVEQGRMGLDDTAGRWLPWLQEAGAPLAAVTVRELLSNAGGVIRDGRDSDFWQLNGAFLDREALKAEVLAAGADVLKPNEHFKYSNIGFSLAGLIIEAVAGEPYNDYVQREIVDRLGLRNMGPELNPARAAEYAAGYSGLRVSPRRIPIDHVDTQAMSAATGFYSNATDLAAYFSAHFLGDPRLLTDASKRRMQQGLWDTGEDGGKYGLGMILTRHDERLLQGHSGGYPGHITSSLFDPKAKIAVSVLTNAIDGPAGVLATAAFSLLDLAAKPVPQGEAKRSDAELRRFTGRFATLWGVVDVALLGGRLYSISPDAPDPAKAATPLKYIDAQTLEVAGGSPYGRYGERMRYRFGPDGKVVSIQASSTLVPLEQFPLPDRYRVRP